MTVRASPFAFALRPRTARDTEPIADLWVASWQEALPAIDFSARRDWLVNRIVGLETEGAVTICAVGPGERPAGFVTLNAQTGWIDQLAVAPAAKGSGVAGLLLEEARRLSPLRLSLEVNVDNPRARRFYEREGFEPIGEGVNPRSGLKTLRLLWKGRGAESV